MQEKEAIEKFQILMESVSSFKFILIDLNSQEHSIE